MLEVVAKLAVASGVLGIVLSFAGLLTWVERKQSALIQDRVGANRASIFGITMLGLFHPLADAIKMCCKEDYIPPSGNKVLHTLAPFVSLTAALIVFAAIPFGDTLRVGGRDIVLQVADIDVGLLYVLAVASLGVYGVILAGYASNNNYGMLGSMRAASQMLSYEIAMGVSLIGIVLCYGTLDLQEIVRAQGRLLWGWLPLWGVWLQPIGALIFMTAGIAASKRIPFDLPEGESEIIGYFVEYSGMKFGMFFMTDFLETVLVAALTTTLFLGGWQVPGLTSGAQLSWTALQGIAYGAAGAVVCLLFIARAPLAVVGVAAALLFGGAKYWWLTDIPIDVLSHLTVALLQVGAFLGKVVVCLWLFMQVRWTLPRFRYDQLMRLGWKFLFPLALINIAVTAAVVVWWS